MHEFYDITVFDRHLACLLLHCASLGLIAYS